MEIMSYTEFIERQKANKIKEELIKVTRHRMPQKEGEKKKHWNNRLDAEVKKNTYLEEALKNLTTDKEFQMLLEENETDESFRNYSYKKYMLEKADQIIEEIIHKKLFTEHLRTASKTLAAEIFDHTIEHLRTDELFFHGTPVSFFNMNAYLYANEDEKLKFSFTQAEIKDTEEFKECYKNIMRLPYVKEALTIFSIVEKEFQQKLEERIIKLLKKKISNIIKMKKNRKNILEIIENNPYVVSAYEKEINELKVLLPKHVKDIFVNARKKTRRFILHIGPTNSGKTYTSLQAFREAPTGAYLGPLRLLALEVYEGTNEQNVPCSLLTGEEESIVDGATHIAQTIEMANLEKHYDVAVVDEAQMISDPERGGAWTNAILGLNADIIHVCMAEHAERIVTKLIEYCEDEIVEIIHTKRLTPLVNAKGKFSYPKSVKTGDALILFSKRNVISCAAELQAKGYKCSVIYGALPYDTRKSETERFLNGETNIVVATDAIGMGLNLPVKRIIFMENQKFDGSRVRNLYPSEIQQIAGRAGRKGMYEKGEYTSLNETDFIVNGINTKTQDIEKANLSFPKILANVNGSLSNIIKKWTTMTLEEFFIRGDISDMIDTCIELERIDIKRNVILDVLSIPVNKNNAYLNTYWFDFIITVNKMGYITIGLSEYDIKTHNKIAVSVANLNTFENLYQELDLLYNFIRVFGKPETKTEEKELILKEKKKIAEKITEILKTQKLNQKRCSICGKPLPFNHPYGMCKECYEKNLYRRYERWNLYTEEPYMEDFF